MHQVGELIQASGFAHASLVPDAHDGQFEFVPWDSWMNRPLRVSIPKGSAIQNAVWDVLLTIPMGQTRSYQWVADTIERPKSVRAVANAVAANELAWFVPCHRVIRSDGSLGGYKWGIDNKKDLLDWELNG